MPCFCTLIHLPICCPLVAHKLVKVGKTHEYLATLGKRIFPLFTDIFSLLSAFIQVAAMGSIPSGRKNRTPRMWRFVFGRSPILSRRMMWCNIPMPTSQHQQISTIVDLIILLNPQSVLDVGVGFGKYGVLCREYLELWDGREEYHRFRRRIDGIEIFPDYLTPLHTFIYNTMYTGDAQTVIDKLREKYDLVLLIDVLEHLPKQEGRLLIKKLLSKHRGVIISTPKDIGDQQEVFENAHEAHLSQWSRREFAQFGPAFFAPDPQSHVVYIGQEAEDLQRQRRLAHLKQWVKQIPGVKRVYHTLRGRGDV